MGRDDKLLCILRRKIFLEQYINGNSKDLEKFADLLDIAIVNLKEANRLEELKDGLWYIKLQKVTSFNADTLSSLGF